MILRPTLSGRALRAFGVAVLPEAAKPNRYETARGTGRLIQVESPAEVEKLNLQWLGKLSDIFDAWYRKHYDSTPPDGLPDTSKNAPPTSC